MATAGELDDMTECSICTELYDDPKVLPCSHTFCLKCLAAFFKDRRAGQKGECPMCRHEFVVPAGGVTKLPRNVYAEKLVLTVAKVRELQKQVGETGDDWSTKRDDMQVDGARDEMKRDDMQVDDAKEEMKRDDHMPTTNSDGVNDADQMKMTKDADKTKQRGSFVAGIINSYMSTPELVLTLEGGGRWKGIRGLTCMDGELFLIRHDTPEVEVYDVNLFALQRRLPVKRLRGPGDIGSNEPRQALFITDYTHGFLVRLDLYGKKVKQWAWRVGGHPRSVHVTKDPDCSVFVTFSIGWSLKEFNHDGKLLRKVSLESGISGPLHTVQLASGQLLVSHAGRNDRVTVVDSAGRACRSYGAQDGSSTPLLNHPRHLAVDNEGFILIADRDSHRIVLLSPDLHYVRDLINSSDLRCPQRLCLDETRGLLYVVEGRDGGLLIFRVNDV